MAKKEYEVIKNYGLVAKHGDLELKFQLVSWYGNKPKYDLRPWNKDYGMKGMVFEEETLKNLHTLLKEFKKTHPVKEKETVIVKDIVASLTSLPATDCNFTTALKEATKEDLEAAIKKMTDKPGNKTRLLYCQVALEKLKKTKVVTPIKPAKSKASEVKTKAKIVEFPKDKPSIIELAKTNEHHTIEECKAKLNKEREIFNESDSQYVIDGILEAAVVNQDFRNNIMREDKSYAGAFEYFSNKARGGYCMKYGDVSYLDNNLALGLAIDYFNADEEAMKPKPTPKAEPKKRGRKKKGE